MPIVGPNEVNGAVMDYGSKKMWTDFMAVQDSMTAFAGGGQGSATLITAMFARVTTVVTAADSVKLPVAQPGLEITVVNAAAANSMNIFPSTGEIINALSANTAIACAANKVMKFIASGRGQWHSILTA